MRCFVSPAVHVWRIVDGDANDRNAVSECRHTVPCFMRCDTFLETDHGKLGAATHQTESRRGRAEPCPASAQTAEVRSEPVSVEPKFAAWSYRWPLVAVPAGTHHVLLLRSRLPLNITLSAAPIGVISKCWQWVDIFYHTVGGHLLPPPTEGVDTR